MARQVIDSFKGEYDFLSNFHPSVVVYNGSQYPTVEHAYQAAKTDDVVLIEQIRTASTPGKAKKLGRNLELRPDWEERKRIVMVILLVQKFKYGTELAEKLMATDPYELIEGNWWGDVYWGVCKGIGQNHLGKILMRIRTRLIQVREERKHYALER